MGRQPDPGEPSLADQLGVLGEDGVPGLLGPALGVEGATMRGPVEPLEQAKRLDSRAVRTRYLLGYSLLMLNRLDEAREQLEYVRLHKPGDEQTLFSLVKLYQRKRDGEKAGTAFRELRQAHPNSVLCIS